MSVYMTEQEQIEAIKTWWKRYSSVITVFVSIILLAIAGFKYWNWHIEKTTQLASSTYEHLMVAFSNKDDKQIQSYANQLIKEYDNTIYAYAARLTLAKLFVSHGNLTSAKSELDNVASQSKMPAMRQIAKIRMARILLSEQKYDKALQALDEVVDTSYNSLINELRGDVYAETGKQSQAIASYRKAISDSQTQGIANLFLEMKTNELASITQTHSQMVDNEQQQVAA